MIENYIKLRDKKAEIKAQQDEVLKQYTDAMIEIENFLKAHLQQQGITSVASKHGTAFVRRKRSATVADRGVFREYVISSGNFDLADFHAKPEAVEDFFKENDGRLPPGVNYNTYETVSVNRK